MSDFKKLRNVFTYNGMHPKWTADKSQIVIELNGVDLTFQFSAGGDVLADIDVSKDEDALKAEFDKAYEEGYEQGIYDTMEEQ